MTNGITPEEEKFIDQQDLKNRFPEECKRLPIDYLEDHEKILVEKCINQEEFTTDELSDLKKLLADYRPFLNRYDPIKTEENIKNNVRIIKSSKELLNLLDNPDRYRFDMHYNLDGELLRLQFKLKPLPDNEYMDLLSVQTRIFRELDNNEKSVYSKMINGMELTKEEQNMQQQVQDKIIDLIGDIDDSNERITEFLINHVELTADDDTQLTKEIQEKLWHKIDIGTRNIIYNKCKQILKIDEELEVELFPSIK